MLYFLSRRPGKRKMCGSKKSQKKQRKTKVERCWSKKVFGGDTCVIHTSPGFWFYMVLEATRKRKKTRRWEKKGTQQRKENVFSSKKRLFFWVFLDNLEWFCLRGWQPLRSIYLYQEKMCVFWWFGDIFLCWCTQKKKEQKKRTFSFVPPAECSCVAKKNKTKFTSLRRSKKRRGKKKKKKKMYTLHRASHFPPFHFPQE